jgi:hypothetical protein
MCKGYGVVWREEGEGGKRTEGLVSREEGGRKEEEGGRRGRRSDSAGRRRGRRRK